MSRYWDTIISTVIIGFVGTVYTSLYGDYIIAYLCLIAIGVNITGDIVRHV